MSQQAQLALAYDNPTPPPRRTGPRQPVFYVLPPRPISKRHVARFALLSILLHALVILIFGAPSGGSREGRAMWGSLQVLLPAPVPDLTRLKLDTAPPVIPAETPVVPVERASSPESVIPAKPAIPVRPPVRSRPAIVPYTFPPLLDRLVVPEPKLQLSPTLRVPPPTEVQAPPAPPDPIPPPTVERVPVEPPPIAAPLVAPVPAPIPPAAPIVETAPAERPPLEVPAIPVPPIQGIEPPRIESAPKPIEPTAPPPQEIPVVPKPATALERALEREPAPRVERAPLPKEEPASRPSPAAPPLPPAGSIKRPDEPATTYDPTAPSIDLDAVRKRAGELAREGSGRRALLPFPMPPIPEKKSKMETAIENARKPDCRTAYQNLGLAAVVPLIANEFGEGNCRW